MFEAAKSILNMRSAFLDLATGRGIKRENYEMLQSERLRRLVHYAYENVEMYRRKYDVAGVKPEDIRSIADIHKLPLVTKSDLRDDYPGGILSRRFRDTDCFVVSSTGTTGDPVRVFKRRQKALDLLATAPLALMLLPRLAAVMKAEGIERRTLAIVAMDEDCVTYSTLQEVQKAPRFVRGSLDIVNSLAEPEEHIRALLEYRPHVLISYPGVLRSVAALARRTGVTLPQPKLLVIGGELMDDYTRKAIASAFRGKLVEHYGATEVGAVALGCPQEGRLHIMCMLSILEVVHNGEPVPPGVPGKAVVTDLWNMATPVIRYSGLDDVLVLGDEQCPCGSKLPVIKVIHGRTVDSFVLPDGELIHPGRLLFALAHIPEIAYYQVIQEQVDKVRVLVVEEGGGDRGKPSPFAEGQPTWGMIVERFRKLLGSDVQVTIEVVNEIPRPAGSRFYPVVRSLVDKSSVRLRPSWDPDVMLR